MSYLPTQSFQPGDTVVFEGAQPTLLSSASHSRSNSMDSHHSQSGRRSLDSGSRLARPVSQLESQMKNLGLSMHQEGHEVSAGDGGESESRSFHEAPPPVAPFAEPDEGPKKMPGSFPTPVHDSLEKFEDDDEQFHTVDDSEPVPLQSYEQMKQLQAFYELQQQQQEDQAQLQFEEEEDQSQRPQNQFTQQPQYSMPNLMPSNYNNPPRQSTSMQNFPPNKSQNYGNLAVQHPYGPERITAPHARAVSMSAEYLSPLNQQPSYGQNMGMRNSSATWDEAWRDSGSPYGQMQNRASRGRVPSINIPAQVDVDGPLLNQSHLKPKMLGISSHTSNSAIDKFLFSGSGASLLSHKKTLELYRANAEKTNDPELMFELAVFLMDASKSLPTDQPVGSPLYAASLERPGLQRDAIALLRRLADKGHVEGQYFLADCYTNGIGTLRNRQDFDKAFPLFVSAAKHGHGEAAYRAGTCFENGWGCRRDNAKAISFYRKAASALHPGACYRLGTAELNGELGMAKSPKAGIIWLKRSAELATEQFPHALYELALLHEEGIENAAFADRDYSLELLAQAAELKYAPAAYKLGNCYEWGNLGCPQDPALSIHFYQIAAEKGHLEACYALTAWYLVGSPDVLPQSDEQAFLWAKKAAEGGLAKAMYAIAYYTEMGIGTPAVPKIAHMWYLKAAKQGDQRAIQRLSAGGNPASKSPTDPKFPLNRPATDDKEKDCVIQ